MTSLTPKQLLTPVHVGDADFFHTDWNMNLYRGCSHGCIYCDSRSLCYGIRDFDHIQPKEGAIALLAKELRSKRKTGMISMGAMSDPYNPLEAKLQLTRQALALMARYRFGASYTTKSALCARDKDVLCDIARYAPVDVRLTVTCADDDLCRRIEPHVSPTSQRLAALRKLADAGIFGGVWLNPVLPFITDSADNIRRIVALSADAGARYVVCFFGMTLRSGNREYYFDALQRDFPGVRDTYIRTFGNAYECPARQPERLFEVFREACQHHGLLWRFEDINRALLVAQPRQLSLFDTPGS